MNAFRNNCLDLKSNKTKDSYIGCRLYSVELDEWSLFNSVESIELGPQNTNSSIE